MKSVSVAIVSDLHYLHEQFKAGWCNHCANSYCNRFEKTYLL